MGIIDKDDIIAWRDGQKIICCNCTDDDGEMTALTKEEVERGDEFMNKIIKCDECGERIY